MIFINFVCNANLLALFLPLSALFYALLDSPHPSPAYWQTLMLYLLAVIVLKFLYQLPLFCGSPAFTLVAFQECAAAPVIPESLIQRLDYIIGIHKFAGESSYPRDQGMLKGIAADLLTLLALLLHKNYLITTGVWHYIRITNNVYTNPSFKCKDMTHMERLNLLRQENYHVYEYSQSTLLTKCMLNISLALHAVYRFGLKLLP